MGTLVGGLVMNHIHKNGKGTFCEVSFCNCSTKDGRKICTCHHPELQPSTHHQHDEMAESHHSSSSEKKVDFCYFSTSQAEGHADQAVVIEYNKYNAICDVTLFSIYSYSKAPIRIPLKTAILSGITDDLLKPPRA